jgi:tetratricopeptide (TPR) repeat protein
MKNIRALLMAALVMISSALCAQSKNEMPFTSASPEAKKLVRAAWVAYSDAKVEEMSNNIRQAVEKDPEFGIAHAFIYTEDEVQREKNLTKASACQLSADEKLLINGLMAAQRHEPVADYFEPLLKKYPKDDYLHLWIMLSYHDAKRSAEIGELIIKRNPKFAPAYNKLGYDYMAQGDLKNAESNFNKYLSLRPDLANVYDSKGDYLMRVGKTAEAITSFEKAAAMGLTPSKGRADIAKAKLKYPGPSDKDKEEIKNLISASSAAYVNGDVEAVLKYYSDQALEFL